LLLSTSCGTYAYVNKSLTLQANYVCIYSVYYLPLLRAKDVKVYA
jgi:hypothetical protein